MGAENALAALVAEADLQRQRLAADLAELKIRARPSNLAAEAEEMLWTEVDRVTDELIDTAGSLLSDGADWVGEHRLPVVAGTIVAAAAALAIWVASRKNPVPLYAAYAMEDPDIMDDFDERAGRKAAAAWTKVKDSARDLGDRAESAYASARSKAQDLSADARERAADAADLAIAAARDAADAAREAAANAREAAIDASRWARRQPQENPATVMLVALAAGAVIGALLPTGRRRV